MHKTKLFVIAFFLFGLFSCETEQTENNDEKNQSTTENPPAQIEDNWQTYESKQHNVSLSYPASWVITEHTKYGGRTIINLYPKNNNLSDKDLPLHFHGPANISYISIMPQGVGTELPAGKVQPYNLDFANVNFAFKEDDSKQFLLNNNSTWAVLLQPEANIGNPTWSEYGGIFAQAGINNFSAQCKDGESGKLKKMSSCDPLGGDEVIKKGNVKSKQLKTIKKILASVSFNGSSTEKVTEMITIDKPLPNIEISSPLKVKGEAKGYWYFEADFPITLEDRNGNVLDTTYGIAKGKWMTEDFVPFEAVVQYTNAPDDERGYLVFHRANPSGLEENEQTYRLPVLFPPK